MVDCPFKIIEKSGEKTYKLELLDDYDISYIQCQGLEALPW